MFSRSSEYAFQALSYIATVQHGKPVRLQEIAQYYKPPVHFLSKVLQKLVKGGLLNSRKGPNGGFTLAKPADRITLLEVVHATSGTDFLEACLIGSPYCCASRHCPLHDVKENIYKTLQRCTIAQLLDPPK